jgi:hypothetical protein
MQRFGQGFSQGTIARCFSFFYFFQMMFLAILIFKLFVILVATSFLHFFFSGVVLYKITSLFIHQRRA